LKTTAAFADMSNQPSNHEITTLLSGFSIECQREKLQVGSSKDIQNRTRTQWFEGDHRYRGICNGRISGSESGFRDLRREVIKQAQAVE